MFTKERVNEILAACSKATEEPWVRLAAPDYAEIYASPLISTSFPLALVASADNADFIALARTVLPQLAQRVLELEGEVDPYWMNKAQELEKENAKLRAVAEIAHNACEELEGHGLYAINKLHQTLADAGYWGEEATDETV